MPITVLNKLIIQSIARAKNAKLDSSANTSRKITISRADDPAASRNINVVLPAGAYITKASFTGEYIHYSYVLLKSGQTLEETIRSQDQQVNSAYLSSKIQNFINNDDSVLNLNFSDAHPPIEIERFVVRNLKELNKYLADFQDKGKHDDHKIGTDDHDVIRGGKGDDTLYGGKGDDELYGGVGDDALYGGDGNDWIDGGRGYDVLYGGDGLDRFVFNNQNAVNSNANDAEKFGVPVVKDFELQKDKVVVEGELLIEGGGDYHLMINFFSRDEDIVYTNVFLTSGPIDDHDITLMRLEIKDPFAPETFDFLPKHNSGEPLNPWDSSFYQSYDDEEKSDYSDIVARTIVEII